MRTLAEAVRQGRSERGESIVQSAAAIGISPAYLQAIEVGQKKNPTFTMLYRLVFYFGISFDHLVPPDDKDAQ